MPFFFSLDAVLHLRQSLEHQQELRLRSANQQVARVRHLLEQMDLHRRQIHSMQSRELSAGVTSAELRFGLLCEAELLRHRHELEHELARLQQFHDQQREILQLARRTRETLEIVRDQQRMTYRKEIARRTQRNLDDLFLLRRDYLRRS
ncbi:MAG TPA: flagellar FliJ family protein [Candidatus Acidoferrum sp.]|jgi:flagellar export protein FliJ|nr:flagellar FliJ family protein [Candidatus Acidoferrum sp.]